MGIAVHRWTAGVHLHNAVFDRLNFAEGLFEGVVYLQHGWSASCRAALGGMSMMYRKLVLPTVPNGNPAVMTTMPPSPGNKVGRYGMPLRHVQEVCHVG